MSKKIKINELKTDTRNHNRHTKDGMALFENEPIVIETDGTRPEW